IDGLPHQIDMAKRDQIRLQEADGHGGLLVLARRALSRRATIVRPMDRNALAVIILDGAAVLPNERFDAVLIERALRKQQAARNVGARIELPPRALRLSVH